MIVRYVANVRIPTEKAHGAQILKTCEALAKAGVTVELIVPTRKNPIPDDPFAYYAVAPLFTIIQLPVPDTVGYGKIGFVLQTYRFARVAAQYLRNATPGYVYGRDERVLRYLVTRGFNVVWESHTGAWNTAARRIVQTSHLVIISKGLKDFYERQGVPETRMTVAPDAVDVESFKNPASKETARKRLGIPHEAYVALYIGKINEEKGAYTFFHAAALLPSSITAMAIGGEPSQLETLAGKYPKVTFLGSRPYRELADNQQVADVLVVPNSGKVSVSARFTSPLKLYSALASHIPVVASDVPSIREVLDDSTAYLCMPDDPQALAAAIQEIYDHPEEANEKAAAAALAAQSQTWDIRAQTLKEMFDAL